uniref:Venom prothrombin activator porpharin-D-like n=1 Tax=Petromyzon marinus TaxID=7757 RepID=A0AAJ7XGI5_PETMA|nr:venom prothrombin activator porpharin-D-like [Petromyzon marinus]
MPNLWDTAIRSLTRKMPSWMPHLTSFFALYNDLFQSLSTIECSSSILHLSTVFLQRRQAAIVLARARRANSGWEELRKGNLERECMEERCSFEEAREVFENIDATNEFWNKYSDGDQCSSNPCKNNGVCKDGINEYTCYCLSGYDGNTCEISKLGCTFRNGGCQHFCQGSDEQFSCSCAKDYKLHADGKSCQPVVPFPCGRIQVQVKKPRSKREASSVTVEKPVQLVPPNSTVSDNSSYIAEGSEGDLRIAGGQECPLGECPWQVLLLDKKGEGFCGGTILSREWVLTAAHCIPSEPDIVIVGEHNRTVSEPTEQTISIKQIVMHNRFNNATYDNDIALLQMSEPIKFNKYVLPACLPEPDFADNVLKEELARISGWGYLRERGLKAKVLQTSFVPYQDMARCKESSSYTITKNMFCAGYSDSKTDACQGDSGGPHVTPYANTWFSTGIISWGEGCNRKGKFGIYARVSRYLPWIDTVMKNYSVYKDEIPTAGRNLRRSRQN